MNKSVFLLPLIAAVLVVSGCVNENGTGGFSMEPLGDDVLTGNGSKSVGTQPDENKTYEIKTFTETDNEICKEDGKPVIILFSTTWCPHCVWIKDTFETTVNEYVTRGKIVARHWELDIGDDTLTEETESGVPEADASLYAEFNPDRFVPAFVFGCKYYRIGNGFEKDGDLEAEKEEFVAVIETLLKG